MAPTLYMVTPSPAVRAVLITARAIGIELVEKEMNLSAGDHLKPEFVKINPQHTIPTLVDDDGFAIWDSHAIVTYLVSRYRDDDTLYPKNVKQRAIVDQRLFFELGVVFPRLFKTADPIIRGDSTAIEEEDKNGTWEIYGILEVFLDGRKWIAGDAVTVADYSLVTSIGSLHVLVPIVEEKYPKLWEWFNNVQQLPEFEVSKKGLKVFTDAVKSKLS